MGAAGARRFRDWAGRKYRLIFSRAISRISTPIKLNAAEVQAAYLREL
jgi:hypothetical protein